MPTNYYYFSAGLRVPYFGLCRKTGNIPALLSEGNLVCSGRLFLSSGTPIPSLLHINAVEHVSHHRNANRPRTCTDYSYSLHTPGLEDVPRLFAVQQSIYVWITSPKSLHYQFLTSALEGNKENNSLIATCWAIRIYLQNNSLYVIL